MPVIVVLIDRRHRKRMMKVRGDTLDVPKEEIAAPFHLGQALPPRGLDPADQKTQHARSRLVGPEPIELFAKLTCSRCLQEYVKCPFADVCAAYILDARAITEAVAEPVPTPTVTILNAYPSNPNGPKRSQLARLRLSVVVPVLPKPKAVEYGIPLFDPVVSIPSV
jgi:hypothetical protein